MPSKIAEGMPPHLAAHVHALLLQTGLTKTAKKLESEFGEEVRYPLFFSCTHGHAWAIALRI